MIELDKANDSERQAAGDVSGIADRVFGVVWLGISGLIIYMIWKLEVPVVYEPVGPRPFPLLIAVLMSLCCLKMIVSPDRRRVFPEVRAFRKGLALIAILLAYASLFQFFGFPAATVLMVIAMSRLFGGRFWPGLLAATALGIAGYLIFDRVLEVTLPLGRLWS